MRGPFLFEATTSCAVAYDFAEAVFYKFRGSAGMKMLDDLLQSFDPLRSIVDQFTHDVLLNLS